MEGISGKRALVTGGGSGIGRAIALKLSALGAEVCIMGRRKELLKQTVKDSGGKIIAIQQDISEWETTRDALKKILPIHLLVNNAAVALLKPVHEYTEYDFDTSMNVNVKAAMNISLVVTEDLIAKGLSGCIVNVSSQSGQRALKDHLVYCMTKAAIDMMTKSMAFELGPKKIRVNAVSPTVVLTDMGKLGWSDPEKASSMLNRIPVGRFAEVDEVVHSVVFLLSDQSQMINGHSLPVEGGYFTN